VKVSAGKLFRELIGRDEVVIVPHAYDAFSARLIEEAGFKAVLVGGASINAVMGYPDGEATRTEFLGRVREIIQAVNIPVRVDIETGFGSGSALDLMRTIQECERIGVAAVQCEDQVTAVKAQLTVAKADGGANRAHVVSRAEMLKKIEAALEARQDENFVFIARTSAKSRHGLQEALERGKAYAEAGADMISIQSLDTVDELKQAVDFVGAPLLVSALSIDKLALSTQDLKNIGIRMLSVGAPLRTVSWALQALLEEIKRTGTDRGFADRMVSKESVARLVGTPARDALRARFMDYE
jgi:2-methylisocitrate lyase-like PEP mutase family enzyme